MSPIQLYLDHARILKPTPNHILVENIPDYVPAYATGKSEQGYHTGLIFRRLGSIYFDDTSILVHPDHIIEPPEVKITPSPDTPVDRPDVDEPTDRPEPPKKVLSRYYGRVEIDPQRVNKDVGLIVEEVIERLTSQVGCDVQVSLEISARRPEGFDESTIRTIGENSRTLKFEHYGFEEE